MAKWRATLKRGEVFHHLKSNTKFEKNKPKVIDEDLKDYLEETAVDNLNDAERGESFTRPKFVFEKVKEGDDGTDAGGDGKGSAPARSTRRRASSKGDDE